MIYKYFYKGGIFMNMLLIFFAIPLAIVILSAILETYMRCPIKVAGVL